MAHAQSEVVLKVGQAWTIKNAPGEDTQLIIGKIEPYGDKRAVHVSVVGVPVPEGWPTDLDTADISHMPFDYETFTDNVLDLVGENKAVGSGFNDGYATWQDEKGGVFTIPPIKAIDLVVDTVMKQRK